LDEFIKYLRPIGIILARIFWRVHIIFICNNGVTVKLRTFFISIKLVDTINRSSPKKRKYTKKAIEKRNKKAEKALQKKREKAAAKKAAKEAAKANSENAPKKKFNFKFPDDVEDLLDALSVFFKELLHPIFRNTRLRFKRFSLTVASSDPADTAVRYGIISQSAAYFLTVLMGNFKLSDREVRKVKVDCDFLAEKTTIDLHMYISFGVWRIIYIIIRGAIKLLKKLMKFKVKKEPDEKSDNKNKKHKIC